MAIPRIPNDRIEKRKRESEATKPCKMPGCDGTARRNAVYCERHTGAHSNDRYHAVIGEKRCRNPQCKNPTWYPADEACPKCGWVSSQPRRELVSDMMLCARCKDKKSKEEFRQSKPGVYSSYCRECERDIAAAQRARRRAERTDKIVRYCDCGNVILANDATMCSHCWKNKGRGIFAPDETRPEAWDLIAEVY